MKKRLFSLLLALCMTVALFAGLGTTAAAADDRVSGYLVSYTVQAGDTIYGICAKKGINFDANITMIGKINSITNYNYMMPGKVLWLPVASTVTGEAYYTLLSHTLAAGETPASLCQSYGIDYNSSYNLLAALNSNLTTLMTGQAIILPLYISNPNAGNTGAAQTPIPVGGGTAGNTGAAGGTGTTGTTGTAGAAGLPGDGVGYYLAHHVLQSGETVSGVCAGLGVDFMKVSDTIMRINDIVSYNYLLPGKTLLIPMDSVPSSGSYYKVMAHTVAAGETVYGLCEQYGLAYDTYSGLISKLNNRTNLASFYVGETLYMPLYVAAATAGTAPAAPSAPAGGTTGGTTGGTGGSTAPNATPAPAQTPIPVGGGSTGSTGGTGTTGTTGGTGSGTTANVPDGDTLAYVIIPHILQAGETVSQICLDMGVDFDANYDRIMQLSNIASYNYLLPGKEILIPASTAPATGGYYKIMAHTFVAGDTVYDLCLQYGLNYNNNIGFLQRLNDRDNMTSFYAGQTFYLPVYVAG